MFQKSKVNIPIKKTTWGSSFSYDRNKQKTLEFQCLKINKNAKSFKRL